ncbi:MAG: ATP-grasp domain-containing protein [Candidatus Helarchaeota archaeon]
MFEFFSGGGSAALPVSNSILSEGYAMLSSIVADFSKTGHHIISTLDYRIKHFDPPFLADEIIEFYDQDNFNMKFNVLLSQNIDAVFVIAPETDNILYKLVKQVENIKIPIIGPSSNAIKLTADKYKTFQALDEVALIPKTRQLSINDPPEKVLESAQNIGFPFIMKPIDGIAAMGISLIKKEEEITRGIECIKQESCMDNYIIQEYIKGIDASVSLLIGEKGIIPLTLNYQNIDLEMADYKGGYTPLDHPLYKEIIEQSKNIVKKIPGLKGYIGIDYILTPERFFFMEINPRLTTSYVGIRAVCKQNIASALIDLLINKKEITKEFEFKGYSYFSKIELTIPELTLTEFQNKYFTSGIISPPFVVKGMENEVTSAFICSYQENLNDSKAQFEKIKNNLLSDW